MKNIPLHRHYRLLLEKRSIHGSWNRFTTAIHFPQKRCIQLISKNISITTQEYARVSGLSITQVTRMLRSGKIVGKKVGNRWEIQADQLSVKSDPPPVDAPAPEPAEGHPAGFTVEQFEAMTYLTARGVENWLKSGRLQGNRDASGRWLVDAASLELPDVRRLLRKS